MAKKKFKIKTRRAMQWKVERGLHIRQLARFCEEQTGNGWNVFSILGPHGNLAVVLNRMLTL